MQPGQNSYESPNLVENFAELENAGFLNGTVNQKYDFMDPDTGIHTQHVERIWGSAKWQGSHRRL